jgi:hypothetical protein
MYIATDNCICWSLKLYRNQGTLGSYRHLASNECAHWSLKVYINQENQNLVAIDELLVTKCLGH